MVETLPEYILTTQTHEKTIVKNLVDRIKKVNRLIYDQKIQHNPTNVNDFNRFLLQVRSDAINIAKEQKALIGSSNSPSSLNPASTKKQKMSTSPYRTAVIGSTAAKVCSGFGLNAHNQEHHNWGNCLRRTHPEFNSEEHVAYANSTAGRTATTRRHAAGLHKTYPAPFNHVPAAGNAGGGGRGGRGRDGPGNRGTITCTPCLITSGIASLSLKSDTNLIPLLFKVADQEEACRGRNG